MNMDKNQAKREVSTALQYFPEAKKSLARIKNITDPQKRCEEAKFAHDKH